MPSPFMPSQHLCHVLLSREKGSSETMVIASGTWNIFAAGRIEKNSLESPVMVFYVGLHESEPL